jgi:hypothetical protein
LHRLLSLRCLSSESYREIRIIMSMNFERWKHLSALASTERDPEKLTDLARELNIVLNEKTQTLDSRPPQGLGIITSGQSRLPHIPPR